MSQDKKHNKDSLRNMIRTMLSEDFYSIPTMGDQTVSYSTPDTDKSDIYYYQTEKPEETVFDKAKKLNLPYSSILKKFNDEDLSLLSKLAERFRKTGQMEIQYKLGWHGPMLAYIIEFLGAEVKKNNDKALLKLMEIFNPTNDSIKEMFIQYYNKWHMSNENISNIDNVNSKEVLYAVENMEKLQVVNKNVYNYLKKGRDNSLLKYLITHLRLRFITEYDRVLKNSKKALLPKKELGQSQKYANTYYISDIQNYLYKGNDEDGSNDNFIKFNKANKEIINALKAKKHNPKVIAIISGMIDSKLDSEEMVSVYPKLFKDKRNVARVFSQSIKSNISEYMDGVYKKHGLNLPPVSQWKSQDIANSQDPTKKLKKDNFGSMFEIRKIVRETLIKEFVSSRELDRVEDFADNLFNPVGVDIEFTDHFMDRLNDPRNIVDIESVELKDLFSKLYTKYGEKIPNLRRGTVAVINDVNSNINIPFALNWDKKNKKFDMVHTTVMRTKNFKTGRGQMKLKV